MLFLEPENVSQTCVSLFAGRSELQKFLLYIEDIYITCHTLLGAYENFSDEAGPWIFVGCVFHPPRAYLSYRSLQFTF